jgi:hypothetical protein
MKKQEIEIFLLNLFYKDPEKTISREEAIIEVRKAFYRNAVEKIDICLEDLLKNGFIKEVKSKKFRLEDKKYDKEDQTPRVLLDGMDFDILDFENNIIKFFLDNSGKNKRDFSRKTIEQKCSEEYHFDNETIIKHWGRVTKKFLKKVSDGVYRLPNRKNKQGKQYNGERFLKRIIETYELDKYYYLYEDDKINHLWEKLIEVYRFSPTPTWSKKKTEEMNIRHTANTLRRSFYPEAQVLYLSVLRKLKKHEEISIESILKDLKESEQELLKEVDELTLPVIDYYLNNRHKDSNLFFIFSKLRHEIESEKKRRIKDPFRWDI